MIDEKTEVRSPLTDNKGMKSSPESQELEKSERTRGAAAKAEHKAQTELAFARGDIKTLNKQVETLRASVKKLEGRVLPTTPGSRVWVSVVIWGGRIPHQQRYP